MSNLSESAKPVIWLKIGKHFIDEAHVRSVSRKGKGTLIELSKGEDITVEVPYEKVMQLLPKK